ncbi:MAG: hypothetical protein AAB692_05660 [Patescibacteria group bacterium]
MALYLVNRSKVRLYVQVEGTNPMTKRLIINVSTRELPPVAGEKLRCIVGHDQQVQIPGYRLGQEIKLYAKYLEFREIPKNKAGNRILVIEGLLN